MQHGLHYKQDLPRHQISLATPLVTVAENSTNQEIPMELLSQLNLPSSFSSAELLKMLEEQKKEIEELQGTLKQQQSGMAIA